MALILRLKRISDLKSRIQTNLVSKNPLHTHSKPPCWGPPSSSLISPKRRFFYKFFRNTTQNELKMKDDVPDHFVLIYRNTMSKYILGAHVISFIVGGVVLLGFIAKSEYTSRETEMWGDQIRSIKNEELYFISFFVLFLVAVKMMVAKTPIRLYKIPETPKYVAVSYGNYFFGTEKYNFKRGEIVKMEESGVLPWKDCRYMIETETERRTVILLEHYFRRPADLSIMIGEQRDPELDE